MNTIWFKKNICNKILFQLPQKQTKTTTTTKKLCHMSIVGILINIARPLFSELSFGAASKTLFEKGTSWK